MTKPDWRVLDHGPIEKLEDNLWAVEGSVPNLPMKRRMTLVRLSDGSVVVHNGISLAEPAQSAIDAWGAVRFIVVPNGWHRLDAGAYAARYPDARVVCPDPAQKRVQKAVRVDGNLSLLPGDPALDHAPLSGSSIQENVLTVRSPRGVTLVFNDTLFNLPKLPGVKGWIYGAIGSTGGPKVTPLLRLVSVRDRVALRANLESLAATPGLTRVIPGHGTAVEGEAAARAVLLTAAASL